MSKLYYLFSFLIKYHLQGGSPVNEFNFLHCDARLFLEFLLWISIIICSHNTHAPWSVMHIVHHVFFYSSLPLPFLLRLCYTIFNRVIAAACCQDFGFVFEETSIQTVRAPLPVSFGLVSSEDNHHSCPLVPPRA